MKSSIQAYKVSIAIRLVSSFIIGVSFFAPIHGYAKQPFFAQSKRSEHSCNPSETWLAKVVFCKVYRSMIIKPVSEDKLVSILSLLPNMESDLDLTNRPGINYITSYHPDTLELEFTLLSDDSDLAKALEKEVGDYIYSKIYYTGEFLDRNPRIYLAQEGLHVHYDTNEMGTFYARSFASMSKQEAEAYFYSAEKLKNQLDESSSDWEKILSSQSDESIVDRTAMKSCKSPDCTLIFSHYFNWTGGEELTNPNDSLSVVFDLQSRQ